ncbi:MAG: hypothetical protein ACI8TP_002619 [Acidimicrobiales bacterium]|jgi:hypothetical protein
MILRGALTLWMALYLALLVPAPVIWPFAAGIISLAISRHGAKWVETGKVAFGGIIGAHLASAFLFLMASQWAALGLGVGFAAGAAFVLTGPRYEERPFR